MSNSNVITRALLILTAGWIFNGATAQAQGTEAQRAAECTADEAQLAALEKSPNAAQLTSEITATQRQILLVCKPIVRPPPPPQPNQVTVEGIEIVQSIQDLQNDVPLIADKQTWVRVYLSALDPAIPEQLNVVLTVSHNGTTKTLSAAGPVTVNPNTSGTIAPQRQTWAGSINVLVPSSLTSAGPATFTLTGLTGGGSLGSACYGGCPPPINMTFQDAPTLKVRIFSMKYNNAGAGKPAAWLAPSGTDVGLLKSWLGRAYPVGSTSFATRNITLQEANGSTAATTADVASAVVNCNTADAQLSAIRAQDIDSGSDEHTHYFGAVTSNGAYMRGCADAVPASPDPSTTASGPTGPLNAGGGVPVNDPGDRGPSYGAWYGGHEIGHTFGRAHPGFCPGNSHSDPNFPYPNGWISDGKPTAYAGLDVGDPAYSLAPLVIWVTDFDIMTYCNQPQWLSAYTYKGVLARLYAENPGFSRTGAIVEHPSAPMLQFGPFVHVAAVVNLTKLTGVISYVNPVTRAATVVEPSTRVQLVVRDAAGKVLSSTPAPLREDTDTPANEDHKALVDAAVPVTPDAAEVDLVVDGKVLDSFRPASPSPPPVQNLRLDTLATGGNARQLRWEAPTPALKTSGVRPPTYIVQVTHDGGTTWDTVAIGVTDLTHTLDDVDAQQVRVISTNGFIKSAPAVLTLPSAAR